MNATGFLKRSIADQTGFLSYSLDLLLNNTSGECALGLSGSGNQLDFRLVNGKIYSDDGDYVGNYDKDALVNLSGNIGTLTNDLYLNGELSYLGKSKPTGRFSHFYIHPEDVDADFSLIIGGQLPQYKFDATGLFTGANDILTGVFINLNPQIRFRFFSGQIRETNSIFTLSGLNTGDIINSGSFFLVVNQFNYFQNVVPIEFVTNFGTITVNFTGSGKYPNSQEYFFLLPENETEVLTSTIKSYDLYYNIPVGTPIDVTLSGASGFYNTGIIGTGVATGLVSGYMTGSGLISGLASGEIFGPLMGVGSTGSGIGSGYISSFQFATGDFNYSWILTGTGCGTGIGFTGCGATGIISGTETFTISGASGLFMFNKLVTGDPFDPGFNGTSIINTGVYFSGWLEYTYSGTGFYILPATGNITGELIVKDFVWNLFTGVDGNNLIDFKDSEFHNHSGYYRNTGSSGVFVDTPPETFTVRVSYDLPSGSGLHLVYLLVSGFNSSGIQLTLTGTI